MKWQVRITTASEIPAASLHHTAEGTATLNTTTCTTIKTDPKQKVNSYHLNTHGYYHKDTWVNSILHKLANFTRSHKSQIHDVSIRSFLYIILQLIAHNSPSSFVLSSGYFLSWHGTGLSSMIQPEVIKHEMLTMKEIRTTNSSCHYHMTSIMLLKWRLRQSLHIGTHLHQYPLTI